MAYGRYAPGGYFNNLLAPTAAGTFYPNGGLSPEEAYNQRIIKYAPTAFEQALHERPPSMNIEVRGAPPATGFIAPWVADDRYSYLNKPPQSVSDLMAQLNAPRPTMTDLSNMTRNWQSAGLPSPPSSGGYGGYIPGRVLGDSSRYGGYIPGGMGFDLPPNADGTWASPAPTPPDTGTTYYHGPSYGLGYAAGQAAAAAQSGGWSGSDGSDGGNTTDQSSSSSYA
jgi:hypothetical protein